MPQWYTGASMAITLADAGRNAACNAIVDLADAASPPAVIELATNGTFSTILAAITMNNPTYGDAASGVATLSGVPRQDTSANATGTAANWRLRQSAAGTTVMSGPVSTSGGGDITLTSATRDAALNGIRALFSGVGDIQITTAADTGFAAVLATLPLNSGGFAAAASGGAIAMLTA